jgi:hypothetical protein
MVSWCRDLLSARASRARRRLPCIARGRRDWQGGSGVSLTWHFKIALAGRFDRIPVLTAHSASHNGPSAGRPWPTCSCLLVATSRDILASGAAPRMYVPRTIMLRMRSVRWDLPATARFRVLSRST